ncbi:MAG: carbohydrate-binding domain-containing protein [Clostridia bacterium]|nr:carbohydrate-binding domain-containing protein [Clostridia bacterium]
MKKGLAVLIAFLFWSAYLPQKPLVVSADSVSHVIINQVYGRAAKTDAAISHSFIELYNPTAGDVDLSAYSIQYASSGTSWIKLDLTGNVIPSHTSFLIRCYSADSTSTTRYWITNYDMDWSGCKMSNDAFKVALVSNQTLLTTSSPTSAEGVIDLVGAGTTDYAEGTAIAGISKQKTARRLSFADTDDNSKDFEIIDYRTTSVSSTGISDEVLEQVKPRCLSDGVWGVEEETEGFPVAISGINVVSDVVESMTVDVSGTISGTARGIAAVYDADNKLVSVCISSNSLDSSNTGTQEFAFENTMTLGENEILRGYVWQGDESGSLTVLPLAEAFLYESEEEAVVGDGIIHLNGTSIDASGISGASVSGTVLTISAAGTYTLEGSLTDGQIIVNTPSNTDEVELVLNGVDVSCSTSGPLFGADGNITLTLASGTINKFTDAQTYAYADGEDEPNACVFAKRNLTVKGDGTLNVYANYNNGIGSKDSLTISGGTVTVDAVNNALKGNDSVTLKNAVVTVASQQDGIKSDSTDGAGYGVVSIESGTISITALQDAVQAVTAVSISGGSTVASCSEDGINCETGTVDITGGTLNITSAQDGIQAETTLTVSGGNITLLTGGGYSATATDESSKGLKGVGSVNITGGTFSINSCDDAVHSNGVVTISGGSLEIWTADDGVHADTTANIQSSSVININKCYEGIEALTINIAGGTTHLTASDDGVNAAGGVDQSNVSTGGMGVPGQSTGSGNGLINISGGYLVVDSTGDGLDANGSIKMTAGTVLVNGPTANDNGALDYDGTFVVSGGLLVAAGSSGMVQAPSTSSTQRSVSVTYRSTQAANTLFTITNSSGASILTFKPSKAYAAVVVCSPNISSGSAYKIYSGGSYSGTAADGLYSGGTYTAGTLKGSFTSTSVVTNVTINS